MTKTLLPSHRPSQALLERFIANGLNDNKRRLQRSEWQREVCERSYETLGSGHVHLCLQRTGTTYDVDVLSTKYSRSMIARRKYEY